MTPSQRERERALGFDPSNPPWKGYSGDEQVVFATLWSTGPDTTLDGIFRLQALRPRPDGAGWESFDRFCRPFEAQGDSESAASARMMREYGVTGEDLELAPLAAEAWEDFAAFCGCGPLLVSDLGELRAWQRHFSVADDQPPPESMVALGISELASLLFPGRLASRGTHLVRELLGAGELATDRAWGPAELQRALSELVRRFLGLDRTLLSVAVQGWTRAWSGLCVSDPPAAQQLVTALGLLDRPRVFRSGAGGELGYEGDLPEGLMSAALEEARSIDELTDELDPACTHAYAKLAEQGNLPADAPGPAPFDEADMSALDDVFQVHLPRLFADKHPTASPSYRNGQHQAAREVARALGGEELLLIHAPTGTGKTLAYLVPAMLWARRHQVRVGIATYTRALQEQAMDQEVPRAQAALARAGVKDELRITVLKGRENYLCWRAMKLHVPSEQDQEGEAWLAWTSLALFGSTDASGDLDRFAQRAPLALASEREYRRVVRSFVRQVRSHSGCCTLSVDRSTCAAEVARRRAERSHVVITNHSFALARQEFFKRLVFDECEHLHDQAHNAWSYSVSLRYIKELLSRLSKPGQSFSRAPLDGMRQRAMQGSAARTCAEKTSDSWREAARSTRDLGGALQDFEEWRREQLHSRTAREEYSLLREYCESDSDEARELIDARRAFEKSWNQLDSMLAECAEHLETLPGRGIPRLRRTFDLVRTEMSETLSAIQAWIPLQEGRPRFRPETFHDVEHDYRGERVLAARVLLPNEYLGRNYYPKISTGVFLSATTWLKGGFEAALGYLGLDRVAEPAEDEERPARAVRTFRAPEVFDYGRVLVAIPRDAPALPRKKDEFLDYVRRFVSYLGERTRGRMLVLFTNAEDLKQVGNRTAAFFRARRIPLWFQNMEGTAKEELGELFRSQVDSILLGVDTFWYGADFPGETLEYLVIVRLPYGVPDSYHHAQCAALGSSEQRRRIYMPRALAKLRQGFGRLMRKESDRGCVFLLDGRVLDPRHRTFLGEIPVKSASSQSGPSQATDGSTAGDSAARLVRGDTDYCIREALAHMGMLTDLRRRGLTEPFDQAQNDRREQEAEYDRMFAAEPDLLDIPPEDVPF